MTKKAKQNRAIHAWYDAHPKRKKKKAKKKATRKKSRK